MNVLVIFFFCEMSVNGYYCIFETMSRFIIYVWHSRDEMAISNLAANIMGINYNLLE